MNDQNRPPDKKFLKQKNQKKVLKWNTRSQSEKGLEDLRKVEEIQPKHIPNSQTNTEFLKWKDYLAIGDVILFESLSFSPNSNYLSNENKIIDTALCYPMLKTKNVNKLLPQISSCLSNKAIVFLGTHELNDESADLDEWQRDFSSLLEELILKKKFKRILLCQLVPKLGNENVEYWQRLEKMNRFLWSESLKYKTVVCLVYSIRAFAVYTPQNKSHQPYVLFNQSLNKPNYVLKVMNFKALAANGEVDCITPSKVGVESFLKLLNRIDASTSEKIVNFAQSQPMIEKEIPPYQILSKELNNNCNEVASESSQEISNLFNRVEEVLNGDQHNVNVDTSSESEPEEDSHAKVTVEDCSDSEEINNSQNPYRISEEICNHVDQWLGDNEVKLNDSIAPIIRLFSGQVSVQALIDTGAKYSFISEGTFQLLKQSNSDLEYVEIKIPEISFKGFVGVRKVSFKKATLIPIKFENKQEKYNYMPTFVVSGLNTGWLIGLDFIGRFNVRIFCNDHIVELETDAKQYTLKTEQPSDKVECENLVALSVLVNARHVEFNSPEFVDLCRKCGSDNEFIEYYELNYREPYSLNFCFSIQTLQQIISDLVLDEDLKFPFSQILRKFSNCFRDEIGCCNLYTHKFQMKEFDSIPYKYYPVPRGKQEAVKKVTDEWMNQGLIEPSNSTFLVPLAIVTKSDGSVRPCGDFREINKFMLTRGERVPKIEEVKTRFSGKKCFSTLDFKSGFLQILLHEDSRKYCAFVLDGRPYQFTRVPFGTRDSLGAFLAGIHKVLEGCESFTVTYVDDVLIMSNSYDEHLSHLETVIERVEKANMTLNMRKCKWFREKVNYLGYTITRESVTPSREKVKAILQIPTPKSLKEVRRFLGMVNYYRSHIPACANIAEPLHNLTKKNAKFVWSEKESTAFRILKENLAAMVMNSHPKYDRPFHIWSDASTKGIGGFIAQYDDDQKLNPIAFISRLIKGPERNYTIYALEMLAIIHILKKYSFMLIGYKVFVYTDHQALTYLRYYNLPNQRLSRWYMFMNFFELEISHIAGHRNVVADALSRFRESNSDSLNLEKCVFLFNFVPNNRTLYIFKNFKELQRKDAKLNAIIAELTDKENASKHRDKFRFSKEGFLMKFSKNIWRILVPEGYTNELISYFHQKYGHLGIHKTTLLVLKNFVWKGCKKEIEDAVNSCEICQMAKRNENVSYGDYIPVIATEPKEMIAVDLYGPLPSSSHGYTHIFVVIDVFTKYVRLFPVKQPTAAKLVEFMKKYLKEEGKIKIILSDNGAQFRSNVWKEFWENLDVEIRFVSPHNAKANSHVERIMIILGDCLRISDPENHKGWAKYVKDIEERINTTQHESTGFAPFELQSKEYLEPDDELLPSSRKKRLTWSLKIRQARDRMKRKVDERFHRHNKKRFKPLANGTIVFVKNFNLSRAADAYNAKQDYKFRGPYLVMKKINDNAYVIRSIKSGKEEIQNIVNLKVKRSFKNILLPQK